MNDREFVSVRCIAKTKNAHRCKRHTLRGNMCWTHLLLLDNLRIKKTPFLNEFQNKHSGIFSGKKEIPKNKTIIHV